MNKVNKSILVPWLLFVLALILLFLSSIVTVVPNSGADEAVNFIQHLLAILTMGFLIHAIYKTVIHFKNRNYK